MGFSAQELGNAMERIYSEIPRAQHGFLPIVLDMSLFTTNDLSGQVSDDEREIGQKALIMALHTLSGWNAMWLSQNPKTPKLYDSGVSYHHDFDIEWWADINRTYARQRADCKVVTAWRVAELNRILPPGRGAKPHISWRRVESNDPDGFQEGDWVYHVVVLRPAESISYDPPPMLDTPAGETLYPAKTTRWDGKVVDMPDWYIEDPSRILGMGWEKIYAESNHKPASKQFPAWYRDATGEPWYPVTLAPVRTAPVIAPRNLMPASFTGGIQPTNTVQPLSGVLPVANPVRRAS